ncbi:putative transcription factor C2H2 family [Rosa chinensis]|uniref:Putative transcription factor C2H2 family n=1 Tax=Rosa chinensis TaxID=74649 RepID=A0A2P6SBP5_ROSCH|nr:putative RING-H2 finger protein ATL71 [Rosa chinensis]PRQ56100.1 putative transcription factor C2H2 family [Rosa chinensis]
MSIISGLAYVLVILIILLSLASYFCSKRAHLSADTFDHSSSSIAGDQTSSSVQAGGAGLDEATITSYPKLAYSKVKLQYGNSTACCCSICLADYKETDMLLVLPHCGHLFHVKCVYPWLRLHATCPICRNSPSPPSLCISCSQITPLPNAPGVIST